MMAPRVGIEPTTNGLTVRRSTAELPGKLGWYPIEGREFSATDGGLVKEYASLFFCVKSRRLPLKRWHNCLRHAPKPPQYERRPAAERILGRCRGLFPGCRPGVGHPGGKLADAGIARRSQHRGHSEAVRGIEHPGHL